MLKVTSYPTVYLVKSSQRDLPLKYTSDRKVEDLTKFLEKFNVIEGGSEGSAADL